MNCHEIVSQIFALFHDRGHQQYGEDVTESQHALQCATFARQNGESPAIVAACLLHDYGHLVHDLGENIADQGVDAHHETLGANRLKKLFKPEVVEPVRLHVAAKRYLCWKEPGYYNGLSDASQRSLLLQGGPMTDNEVSISTAATNHAGRMGPQSARCFLGSPATVTASAITGRITDPREFL